MKLTSSQVRSTCGNTSKPTAARTFLALLLLPFYLALFQITAAQAQSNVNAATKYLCPVGAHVPAADIEADCSKTPIQQGYTPVFAGTPVTFGAKFEFNGNALAGPSRDATSNGRGRVRRVTEPGASGE